MEELKKQLIEALRRNNRRELLAIKRKLALKTFLDAYVTEAGRGSVPVADWIKKFE